MNILFLFYAPMLPYEGGIQRVTENLAKEMKARGHKVCYLSIYNDDRVIDYNYPVPQYFIDGTNGKNQIIKDYQTLLVSHGVTLVINQELREDLLDILSYTPKGIKKITCCHLQPFFSQGDTRNIIRYYSQKGVKAKAFQAFCWLFPSYYKRRTLLEERSTFQKAIAVSDRICLLSKGFIPRIERYIPNVDLSKIIAVNNPNTFNSDSSFRYKKEKVIICVGRHSNAPKKIPLFIDFWILFQRTHNDWKAFIIGDGVDFEFNKRYATRKRASHIEFTGNVKDVASYYKQASFLVMTSSYEGWGMILTEAMNYGCIPCAFDTYESLHDIIDDDKNGIIVQPYDCKQMVSRIEALLSSPSTMAAMQAAAIDKTKNFTVDKIVDKWETIFNTI